MLTQIEKDIQKAIDQAPDTAEYVVTFGVMGHRMYLKRDGDSEKSLMKFDESCGHWWKSPFNLEDFEYVQIRSHEVVAEFVGL